LERGAEAVSGGCFTVPTARVIQENRLAEDGCVQAGLSRQSFWHRLHFDRADEINPTYQAQLDSTYCNEYR
jgi:hypothetical protein